MTEIELYKKMNEEIKECIAGELTQKEALKRITEKYNVHKKFFSRIRIIIAVGYCINGKEDLNIEALKGEINGENN